MGCATNSPHENQFLKEDFSMQKKGNRYGTHRVIEPKGLMTQAAKKIDNTMECCSNEILCDVSALNIDSASFTQISDACGGDEAKIGEMIMGIVAERGKQQNPVTGSGGMFMGNVAKIGDDLKGKIDLKLAEKGKSVTFISSEIDEMLRTCSRLIVMRDRKAVGELNGDDLTQSKIMATIAGGDEK